MRQVNFLIVTPDHLLREEIMGVLTPPYHKVQFADNLNLISDHKSGLKDIDYVVVDELSGWIPDDIIRNNPQVTFIYLDGFARHYPKRYSNFRTISKISLLSTLNHFKYGFIENNYSA